MTKIKIIGDPGQQPLETLKEWLEKYLKKFKLFDQEVWLIFIENIRQLKKMMRKYEKEIRELFPGLPLEMHSLLQEINSLRAKISFFELEHAGTVYIPEECRKKGVPPIILIRKTGKIHEFNLLDEIAHIAEDKYGWNKTKSKALEILLKDVLLGWDISEGMVFSEWLRIHLFDFFSAEMMCQYGLTGEVFRGRQKSLDFQLKTFSSEKGKSKFNDLVFITTAAFLSSLPPSYPKRKDEKKLEKIVIDDVREMQMELLYRKIKSVLSKLESPPKVSNIYKCGSEIIELAQEFLEK